METTVAWRFTAVQHLPGLRQREHRHQKDEGLPQAEDFHLQIQNLGLGLFFMFST